jgi:hypothetical protein
MRCNQIVRGLLHDSRHFLQILKWSNAGLDQTPTFLANKSEGKIEELGITEASRDLSLTTQ